MKSNSYTEVLEKRKRPAIPEEPVKYEISDEKLLATETVKKPKPELQVYSNEDVKKKATEYFKGDELAGNVWMNKYALKDSKGNLYEQTPDEMHWRLAGEIARIESKYPNPMSKEDIFILLKDFKYIIPQGGPMAGIGNDLQISSLSNCFVIGNKGNSDSYGGIMKIDQEQVQLMKRRGGVGHDLSHIRPEGSVVKNTALTSTGIVPFMERYSNSTKEVAQDGRRGALMLSISIKHPDSEKFIDAKMEKGKVTAANVSVKIDDEFMKAVINNKPYVQQYPIDSDNPVFTKEINARELWDKIIRNAWSSAEPGILFWDTITNESIPDCYADQGFATVSTNPCGEIPLCPYDSCRLLALNLYSYVENPFTKEASFNSELFSEHVHYAQRIMDDIIDLEVEKIDAILAKINSDPEDEDIKGIEKRLWENIKEKALQGRRTGIGITAEGDMIAALGSRYGTKEATDFSVEVHKLLAIESYHSSVDLAEERGAFPIFDIEKEKDNPFINRIKEFAPKVYEKMERVGRRNIAMLTIAPTGSVSICTQTTSGIEPVYMISYKRRRKVNPNDVDVKVSFVDDEGDAWEEYNVFHPKFLKWLKVNGYNLDEVKLYSDEELQPLIEKSPYYKATSNDVDWVEKVRMQGEVQKWVDHSISVTVNLPKDINKEIVGKVYQTAWESGCKGMTIYRDGSRDGVLVSNDNKKEEDTVFKETKAPPRPKILEAEIVRFQNAYEKWIAVVGLLDGKPYEIFTGNAEGFFLPAWVTKGWVIRNKPVKSERAQYDFQFEDKDGYKTTIEGLSRMFNKEFWNYAKLISGFLRHGMPLPYAIQLVENLNFDIESINTWKNGVVRTLKKFVPDGTVDKKSTCPECHTEGSLMYKEGCLVCNECGYSKCG
ncbi:MAG: ribonucleoside-diphosphate reductase, adenosylcobalamin-dependent [Bacteroidetes bacterium 4484_249]|nr:MAG: ribonucleoside-diphosphate reductase, adenosylcobalamin-dependent [Bacteroidetes bacterium 4484_249]